MSTAVTIAEVMTRSPKTISINARLSEAKILMDQMGVNYLPVMANGVVETLISDRDIKRFTLPAHKLEESEDLLVGDVATSTALIAEINDPLEKVLRQMSTRHIGAVVVLDQGELAGIFTESDGCRVLADYLSSQNP
jgi:acetoin utilization protein AcuB